MEGKIEERIALTRWLDQNRLERVKLDKIAHDWMALHNTGLERDELYWIRLDCVIFNRIVRMVQLSKTFWKKMKNGIIIKNWMKTRKWLEQIVEIAR